MKNSYEITSKLRDRFSYKSFLMLAACFIVFSYFLCVSNEGWHNAVIFSYTAPLVAAAISYCIYSGKLAGKKRYLACFSVVIWFLLTRWINGDFLMGINDLFTFFVLCFTWLFAIPFADVAGDIEKRKYLDILCLAIVLFHALLFWLVYIGMFREENIVIGTESLTFGFKDYPSGERRIVMSAINYYMAAYVGVTCFFITFYLATSRCSKYTIIPAIILLITFGAVVILSPCRTALVAFGGGLLVIALAYLQKLKIKKIYIIIAFAVLCVTAALIVLFGMDSVYESVTGNGRKSIERFGELSGRKALWWSGAQVLKDEPQIMLRGASINSYMPKVYEYRKDAEGYMHNGFYENLFLMGIPGLLLLIGFSFKLIVSSVRVFFAPADSGVSLANRVMVAIVAALFFMNLFDSVLIFQRVDTALLCFVFALFSGYIFKMDDMLRQNTVSA